jgi:hypothetical protein
MIELNAEFQKALFFLEKTNHNVFITGKAGTGKSTLLDYFRSHSKKKLVVLAPTGVAAVNIQGETIHSFFHFMPGVTIKEAKGIASRFKKTKIYQELEMIIIDEISMVRADLLDCVDVFLKTIRKNSLPFGGLVMVFIGDLYQLPPVVTSHEKEIFKTHYRSPYFFDSKVFQELLFGRDKIQIEFVELEKIYRQKDDQFIRLLNNIRNRSINDEEIRIVNRQYQPEIKAKRDYIYLTSLNKQAEEINQRNLHLLKTPSRKYLADIEGDFAEKDYPTEKNLIIKEGCRVMFLNNDVGNRWINGTTGEVTETKKDEVIVKIDNGGAVVVKPYLWAIYKNYYDEKTKTIEKKVIGSFLQIPLLLAWAITIHKSQGKTFDKIIIDVGRGTFTHGQMYVALSRCQTINGIILKQRLKRSHILMDYRVVKFLTSFQYKKSDEKMPVKDKKTFLRKAAKEKTKLEIVYLKSKDEKSKRVILPLKVATMEYLGFEYLGLEAFCYLRNEKRIFRVEKILEIKLATG